MKRQISVVMGFLMIAMMMVPAFAGKPADGNDISAKITLVRVIKNTRTYKWIESPLPYGSEGYQVSSNFNVKAKVVFEGDGVVPKDAIMRQYFETNGKTKCALVAGTKDIYLITGYDGRIYFHASVTSEKTRFQKLAQVDAFCTRNHPSISMLAKIYENAGSYTVCVNIFAKELTQGRIRVYQWNNEIIAELYTKYGYMIQSLGFLTNQVKYVPGSTTCAWSSNRICGAYLAPDTIMYEGLFVDIMPTYSADDNFTVTMSMKIK